MSAKAKTFDHTSDSEEILNSISHGIGIPVALGGLVLLLQQGMSYDSPLYMVAVSIYGLSFLWTYLSSTLYHAFYKSPVDFRNRLHLLDHTSIYVFIAGTYTPVALFALPETWSIFILGAIWMLALSGILIKCFSIGKYRKLSLVFYLLMGWMILVAVKPLINFAPPELLYWLLAGGLCYSIGTVFFSLRSLKFSHAIWHLFVLGGSVCHFLGIYLHLPVS